MKLALIITPFGAIRHYYYPSLSVCYIATYLEKHLPDMDIAVIDSFPGNTIEKVKKEKADLVGISSTSLEFSNAIRIAQDIRSFSSIPIIIGGVHISALPHTLPECFDIGVIGEGEQTMLELAKLYLQEQEFSLKLGKIKGIAFHGNDGIAVTEPRPLIQPLDRIPHPNLEYFDMEYYLKPRWRLPGMFGRGVHIITSRGCPYKCVFCGGSYFWKNVRFHSANYVVEEIQNLVDKYNVDCVNILDSLFAVSKKRLTDIVKLIKEEKINEKVKFGCQMRADWMNDEIAKLFKEMNMVYLEFGLESGSGEILNYLKRGTTTVEENKRGIEIADKYGFKTGSGFMIGNPNETLEDLDRTYDFILKYPLDMMQIYITTPLPGTELWHYAKQKGIVSENMDWSRLNQFSYDTGKILSDMNMEEFRKALHQLLFAASISSLRKRNFTSVLKGIVFNMAVFTAKNPKYIPLYLAVLKDFMIRFTEKGRKSSLERSLRKTHSPAKVD